MCKRTQTSSEMIRYSSRESYVSHGESWDFARWQSIDDYVPWGVDGIYIFVYDVKSRWSIRLDSPFVDILYLYSRTHNGNKVNTQWEVC